jgi:hypothetical protein
MHGQLYFKFDLWGNKADVLRKVLLAYILIMYMGTRNQAAEMFCSVSLAMRKLQLI